MSFVSTSSSSWGSGSGSGSGSSPGPSFSGAQNMLRGVASKRCSYGLNCTNFRCVDVHPPDWVRPIDPALKCTWKVRYRGVWAPDGQRNHSTNSSE